MIIAKVGSIVIEEEAGGNILIYKSHTPSDNIVIERADINDLETAMGQVRKYKEEKNK